MTLRHLRQRFTLLCYCMSLVNSFGLSPLDQGSHSNYAPCLFLIQSYITRFISLFGGEEAGALVFIGTSRREERIRKQRTRDEPLCLDLV